MHKAARLHLSTTLSAHRQRYNKLTSIETKLVRRLTTIRRAKAQLQEETTRLISPETSQLAAS